MVGGELADIEKRIKCIGGMLNVYRNESKQTMKSHRLVMSDTYINWGTFSIVMKC